MNDGGRLDERKARKKTAWYLDVLLPGAEGQMDYHFHDVDKSCFVCKKKRRNDLFINTLL